jgi:hypothetical protein
MALINTVIQSIGTPIPMRLAPASMMMPKIALASRYQISLIPHRMIEPTIIKISMMITAAATILTKSTIFYTSVVELIKFVLFLRINDRFGLVCAVCTKITGDEIDIKLNGLYKS